MFNSLPICLSSAEQCLHVLRLVQLLSEPQAICEVQGRQPIEWRPHFIEGTQLNVLRLYQRRWWQNPPKAGSFSFFLSFSIFTELQQRMWTLPHQWRPAHCSMWSHSQQSFQWWVEPGYWGLWLCSVARLFPQTAAGSQECCCLNSRLSLLCLMQKLHVRLERREEGAAQCSESEIGEPWLQTHRPRARLAGFWWNIVSP